MRKKAENLSLSTIVVAAIVVIVLIVLVIIFARQINLFGRNVDDCKSKGGVQKGPNDDTAGMACTPMKYDKNGVATQYCCMIQ